MPSRRHLVRGLIYPVPDPRFPFLGVHLTRGLDGSVHAGPNAVLALSRQGYRRGDVRLGDVAALAADPATWRLARRYWRTGAAEVARSMSRRALARSLQRLVPEVSTPDLVPAGSGVRAQAVAPDGTLVDDFVFTGHEAGPRTARSGPGRPRHRGPRGQRPVTGCHRLVGHRPGDRRPPAGPGGVAAGRRPIG